MAPISRRTLLQSAPAVAALAAVPAAAMPSAPDRRAWDATLSELAAVEAEDRAFSPGWAATYERCSAECETIPHADFGTDSARSYLGPASTSNWPYVAQARKDVAALDDGRMRFDPLPDLQEHERLMRGVVDASARRERAVQEVRDRYGMDAADERMEDLGDRLADLRSRLMAIPAPDLAALRVKLLMIPDEKDGDMPPWSADYVRQTFDDVRRLLPAS